jgi:phage-related protein
MGSGMQIVFYRAPSGQEPVREYISSLPLRDRAAAADHLDAIREHGLRAPGVRFKQIRGKLWEFYIEAGASHRVFYVVVTGPMMVLLHGYKKQSQKAPPREVKIAERRMKEVLRES